MRCVWKKGSIAGLHTEFWIGIVEQRQLQCNSMMTIAAIYPKSTRPCQPLVRNRIKCFDRAKKSRYTLARHLTTQIEHGRKIDENCCKCLSGLIYVQREISSEMSNFFSNKARAAAAASNGASSSKASKPEEKDNTRLQPWVEK